MFTVDKSSGDVSKFQFFFYEMTIYLSIFFSRKTGLKAICSVAWVFHKVHLGVIRMNIFMVWSKNQINWRQHIQNTYEHFYDIYHFYLLSPLWRTQQYNYRCLLRNSYFRGEMMRNLSVELLNGDEWNE